MLFKDCTKIVRQNWCKIFEQFIARNVFIAMIIFIINNSLINI